VPSDDEAPWFAARQWGQQEDVSDGNGAALQYPSPLGPEAAFVPRRSSFEAKWGRWCVSTCVAAVSAPAWVSLMKYRQQLAVSNQIRSMANQRMYECSASSTTDEHEHQHERERGLCH